MSIRISNSFTPEEVEILATYGHQLLREGRGPALRNLAGKLIRMKTRLMDKINREEKDGEASK